MKKIIILILGVVFLLSGCRNTIPDQKSNDSASAVAVPAYRDEQSFIDAFLESLPQIYQNDDMPREITLYRSIPLEGYQLDFIQLFGEQALHYQYVTPKLIAKRKSRDGSYEGDRETDKLRQTDQIKFYWDTYGEELLEEEARKILKERASRWGMKQYGDTDYYVDESVERKRSDVSFQIMWMQDNHVFSMWMPGFAEISEENIADYCRAEAFTVSTNLNINKLN